MRIGSMMRRGAIPAAFLAALLFCSPGAYAGGYGGYHYPTGTGVTCSPVCTGVRATYTEPLPIYVGANGESGDISNIWLAIAGTTSGATCGSSPGPLLQFGTEPQISDVGVQLHRIWWEAYSSPLVGPCNNIQRPTMTTLPTISAGDSITLQLECTVGCTSGVAGQTWVMTWTNNTEGTTQSVTVTSYTVFMNYAYVVIELQSNAINGTSYQPMGFAPLKFSNIQIKQSGVWVPMGITGDDPASRTENGSKQIRCEDPTTHVTAACTGTTSIMHTYAPSGFLDSANGPAFYVCSDVVASTLSTLGPPCEASDYFGTNGFGP